MVHPQMFSEDDPILHRFRELAFSFPGVAEKIAHGRPVFFTKKVFAHYSMSNKVDGEWTQHPQSVCLLLPEEERLAVRELPFCWVPGYIGPSGWLGFDLDADTDWEQLAEWTDDSYRMTAPKKLIAELDAAANRKA